MLETLVQLVRTAAREELTPRFAIAERTYKSDGSIVTEADLAMQRRLKEELALVAPDFSLLGEEMSEAEQEALLIAGDDGLWCLDPLDGTSNFAAGLPFFSVSLALLRNKKPVLGMVYDPMRDECFSAEAGRGAWLNGAPLRCRPPGVTLAQSIAMVHFKRLPQSLARALAVSPPYASQRYLGSVALEWSWLAANRYHVYLHGRQKLWDYAAGALILKESGGLAETMEGKPLFTDPLQACSAYAAIEGGLFSHWKTWIQERT